MHCPTNWFTDICAQLGGDAYVITRRDPFFLNPSDGTKDAIYRLTGFTGSSATVLVTREKTFLYVDSRYTLQAESQAPDCTIITCAQPLHALAEHLVCGQKLMVCPWSWSAQEMTLYQTNAANHGWSLILDKDCVIDALIGPIPLVSRSTIQSMDTHLPSFQEKCAAIFTHQDQAHWLLCKGSDIAWLTNLRANDHDYAPFIEGYLWVSRTQYGFSGILYTAMPRFMHAIDPALRIENFDHLNVLPHNRWKESEPCTESLHDHGNDKACSSDAGGQNSVIKEQPLENFCHLDCVVYDPRYTPSGLVRPTWIPSRDFLNALSCCRSIKTPWEIHHMQQSHISDGVALTKFLYWLEKRTPLGDENEWSAAEQLAIFRSMGASYKGPSFPTISAMGANSAMIHYNPERTNSSSLTTGLYLVDSGGQYHFGTTDVTRTLWIGAKNRASLKHKQRYTQVLQAHIHLSQMIFPEGTNGMQLDAIARSFLWQKGWDYAHSTGHGVGCFAHVHESPPAVAPRAPQDAIKEHMIFSIEPGYYEEGWGGIRLENLVLVVRHDADRLRLQPLTLAPFDRTLISRYDLSPEHCRWLNQYHLHVYQTLAPLLDPWEEAWLKDQTQPLSIYGEPVEIREPMGR
jgi:Xaa-Pro aminopeptidase